MLLVMNILLAFAWGGVTGSFSPANLVLGFVISAISLFLIREQVGTVSYVKRIWRVVSLILLFLKELLFSAARVAVIALRPNLNIRPGIVQYPLVVDQDFEIALLANLITLTPGTLSVDVSDDRKFLYVHALDCSDPEALRSDIALGFERKILEAFR